MLSRAVVVSSREAWDQLAASQHPLILVLSFDSATAVARAVNAGHRVVVPLGRTDLAFPDTVAIPPISRDEAKQVLVATGVPEERARELAVLARRSLLAFRRKLAVGGQKQQPVWALPEHGRALLPAMLAGSWNGQVKSDRETVAQLGGTSYEGLEIILMQWANVPDPPVRHVGDAWYVVSREDAWLLLSRYLTRDNLERFEQVVLEVLGAPDPQYDLSPTDRWAVNVRGHTPRWSELLRRGLAESLAVMGARGESTEIGMGFRVSDYATQIVRQLLARANTNWRVWLSLSWMLPFLAEAAPDTFIRAVDRGLTGEESVLMNFFMDKSDEGSTSSLYLGLLRALETLSWSPQYLGYAALLLAKLGRIEPGGSLTNHSLNTLRRIFLLWHPQTAATLDERLHVLDMLRSREPDISWRLLIELLPRELDTTIPTEKPRWRDWCPEESFRVTLAEHDKGVQEIILRTLEDVGESGSRWEELIAALPNLPVDQYDAAVRRLWNLDLVRLQAENRSRIWNALRKLVSRHRSFANAKWALPKEQIDRLAGLLTRFEPDEPVARYGWLFEPRPDLPEGNPRGCEWQAAVAQTRLDAVQALYEQGGLPTLLTLARVVELPEEVGATLGRCQLVVSEEDEILRTHLAADHEAEARFARGFAAGRISSKGREWAEAKLKELGESSTPKQRAELLACMPMDSRTWSIAEALGQETEGAYWGLIQPYGIDDVDAESAVRKFVQYGRPDAAVELLVKYPETQSSLVIDTLESLLQVSPDPGRMDYSFWEEVCELLDGLVDSAEVNKSRLARLEWAFLPELCLHRTPKVLHKELQRSPGFFVEVVRSVFRAEGEEPRDVSDEDLARVRRGHELLRSWRSLPGSSGDGTIDTGELRAWVQQARRLLYETGRGRVGDEMIGHMLSGSPPGPDGIWPHPAVREIIEGVSSEHLEDGIVFGVLNSRGVVVKGPYEGGEQERSIAERYRSYAVALASRWPRTAAMLRHLVDDYEHDAKQEDQEALLREELER